MTRLLCALTILVLSPTATAWAQTKADLAATIDRHADQTWSIAGQIWEWAEPGYQEVRSAKLLADTLEHAGFRVVRGVAEIPTAFTATAGEGKPEGVLIRAVMAENGDVVDGPGRVTRYLGIDKSLDNVDATTSKKIWVEDRGVRVPRRRIVTGPRVGVDYAGPYWAARPWRFRIDCESVAIP